MVIGGDRLRISKRFIGSTIITAIFIALSVLCTERYYHDSEVYSVQVTSNFRSHARIVSTREDVLEDVFNKIQRSTRTSRLPDIIGIGVKKCGTGALVQFLNQHPQIRISHTGNAETFFYNKYYKKGLNWYMRMLPKAGKFEKVLEKTPNYLYSTPDVPLRIRATAPNAKLILSVCNPVSRAFSDFVHEIYQAKGEPENTAQEFAEMFDQATDKFIEEYTNPDVAENGSNSPNIVRRYFLSFEMSIYSNHLREWSKLFNSSQLLVINGDEWLTDPGKLIEQIEDFIGIPRLLNREDFVRSPESGFYCFRRWWDRKYTKTSKTLGTVITLPNEDELFCLGSGKGRTRNGVRKMFNSTREKLRTFYEPYNKELFSLLEQNFDWT